MFSHLLDTQQTLPEALSQQFTSYLFFFPDTFYLEMFLWNMLWNIFPLEIFQPISDVLE